MSRYVPVGIRVPGSTMALGQRVPAFKGRDDLETLMGGQQVSDWVAVSELLFGPVPEGFQYQAKHRSRGAYGGKEDDM